MKAHIHIIDSVQKEDKHIYNYPGRICLSTERWIRCFCLWSHLLRYRDFIRNYAFPERRKTILAKEAEIEKYDIDLTELEFEWSLET
jgi:hypothetical protein